MQIRPKVINAEAGKMYQDSARSFIFVYMYSKNNTVYRIPKILQIWKHNSVNEGIWFLKISFFYGYILLFFELKWLSKFLILNENLLETELSLR